MPHIPTANGEVPHPTFRALPEPRADDGRTPAEAAGRGSRCRLRGARCTPAPVRIAPRRHAAAHCRVAPHRRAVQSDRVRKKNTRSEQRRRAGGFKAATAPTADSGPRRTNLANSRKRPPDCAPCAIRRQQASAELQPQTRGRGVAARRPRTCRLPSVFAFAAAGGEARMRASGRAVGQGRRAAKREVAKRSNPAAEQRKRHRAESAPGKKRAEGRRGVFPPPGVRQTARREEPPPPDKRRRRMARAVR